MRLPIARTAMAVASSAGLVLGAATSAGAAGHDHDHNNRHRGWVNVCQNVNEDHGDHGRDGDHRRPYHGAYKVVDSSYRTQYVDLWGRYDCDQVEVRSGDVRVTVVSTPDHARLRSDYSKSVYVGRNQSRTVTFYYEARGHDRDHAGYSRAA
jgi:hypothetical protein